MPSPFVAACKRYAHYRILGLSGVDQAERPLARRVDRVFRVLTALVAILLLVQWQYEHLGYLAAWQSDALNLGIWLYFMAKLMVPLVLVEQKLLYLRDNWMLLLILSLGLVFALGWHELIHHLDDFRPLLAFYILIPVASVLFGFFIDGQLSTTLVGAALIIVFFGVLVAGVDPSIHNVSDGIWWAIATVSTVGYGDVIPTSPLGRMIGVLLIVIGLGIFVVITANFLGLILQRQAGRQRLDGYELEELRHRLTELKRKQNQILEKLEEMTSRLPKP